jgi:type IX secretion system PorP/SprF family membrane protein
MKSKLIFALLFIVISIQATAQDPVFTQFFLVPETTNPGFTGYQNTWHAGLLHRRQWPDGDRRIDTDYGFVNNMVTNFAAVGLTVMNHHEEFTNYNYLQINGVYSYYIALSDEWGITPGLEAGYGQKNYNFSNLLLEDQIDINTGATSGTSIDPGIAHYSDKIDFLDISAGFVINSEQTWFAAALKHLNRPDISFTEAGNVPLDILISLNAGYYLELDGSPSSLFPEESRILIVGHYLRQSQYNRLDFGGAFEAGFFTIGALAATNPQRRSDEGHFLTSVNPFANFSLGEFTFGYAYDLSTSKLGRTHGVHELAIVWTSSHTCASCDNYKVKLKKNGVAGYEH